MKNNLHPGEKCDWPFCYKTTECIERSIAFKQRWYWLIPAFPVFYAVAFAVSLILTHGAW